MRKKPEFKIYFLCMKGAKVLERVKEQLFSKVCKLATSIN